MKMKDFKFKIFYFVIFGTILSLISCRTLSHDSQSKSSINNSSRNQILSQSRLNQLVDRYDLIYSNAIDHGKRKWNEIDDVIIMVAYTSWLLRANQNIEYNIRRDMNSRLSTASMRNLRAGQTDRRSGQRIPWVGPTSSEIQAEYSDTFRTLNRQKLTLEDTNNFYTNILIQEIGLTSNEIQNLTRPYMEKLNNQLRLP
jgi:hypothetical protein